ncbi:MAG TPA: J domain-containing protein [Ilumatobacteraceae bacterium]|nr:J domain-containing protein [Ilumatobacteraceae bacterium]
MAHTVADHYAVLGVAATASRDEIRDAYRRLARQHHPDTGGEHAATRMAEINEAYRVLHDPARRALYDAARPLARGTAASSRSASPGSTSSTVHAQSSTHAAPVPAPFPWKFLLALAGAGIAFVMINAALTDPPQPPRVDNILQIGSCVDILTNGDVGEVLCSAAHDGVVTALRPVDGICAAPTALYRDRQGLGPVCVRPAHA